MKLVIKNITITMSESLYDRINAKYGSSLKDALSNCVWHGIDDMMFVGETEELDVEESEDIEVVDDMQTQIKNSVQRHIDKVV